jgi:hypothetical protein
MHSSIFSAGSVIEMNTQMRGNTMASQEVANMLCWPPIRRRIGIAIALALAVPSYAAA